MSNVTNNRPTCCASSPSILDIVPPRSPVPHLIHTNDTPSKAEIETIRSGVNRSSDDLLRAENEIARLETIMKELRSKRDCLAQFKRDHVPLLSKIRSLPLEMTIEIFKWCLLLDERLQFCTFTR